MSHDSHLHDDRPPLLPPPARTIQPAAVTPCEESSYTVQPSTFRTSDFRPSRPARPSRQPSAEPEVAISCSAILSAALPPRHLPIISGVRAIVMIPLAAIAPYWNRLLLSLSLLVMRASIRSSHQQSAPPTFAPGGRKHSIFTVDVATSPQHVRKQQIALLSSRKSLLCCTFPAGSPHDMN
jgi:hypothetical protein